MGSLPSEMYLETPTLAFRTNNSDYLAQVDAYWTQLLPVVRPWLRSNGGPILMVQIENEYGCVEFAPVGGKGRRGEYAPPPPLPQLLRRRERQPRGQGVHAAPEGAGVVAAGGPLPGHALHD